MDKLIVGTEKGGYLLEKGSREWSVEGPSFPGWKVSAFGRSPDGTYLAALGSNWFGASIHRSRDLSDWEQVEKGPAYGEDSGLKLNQVWIFHTTGNRIYAGVDQAGLFYSDDEGLSWEPVPALNEFPGRLKWQPGFGGLAAHHILSDGNRLWVGISAVGVFRSEDGGNLFAQHDIGVTVVGDEGAEGGQENSATGGRCVHGLVADRNDPSRIWRQDHTGVYRSRDGADTWERIEEGLPARFGFAIGRNQTTGSLFVAPLTAAENRVPVGGQLAVYRSENDGDSWAKAGTGWPAGGQFNGVLRNAMAVDNQGGVAVGTTGGSVFVTDDNGDDWSQLPVSLPRILAVEAA